jgi:VWFA-related protein
VHVFQFARLIGLALIAVLAQAGQTPPTASPPPGQPRPQPSPQQQPTQPPRFRTEANLVRVDVFATKGGEPVQDLTAADFELYEDNAPQKIDSFEHIVVSPAGPEAGRVEPNSVSAGNQLAADPRRRVFVIFLDTEHVDVAGSHNIKEPLIEMMTRVIGADDLVGVMTPEMSADQITFGRRTEVIEDGLRRNWTWGRRDTIMLDEREKMYEQCFPPVQPNEPTPSYLASALIKRRRERMVLDSLQNLIRHMAAIREGRTAVITVSDGWVLYRPDQSLTMLRTDPQGRQVDPIPGGPPPVGVGPGGTLTKRPVNDLNNVDRTECEKDQMDLAMTDDERYFRDIFGEANKANVSFYPIDPRGLAVFDTAIGPEPPLSPTADYVQLRQRGEALRTLAVNTDGIAMMGSNDLRKELRRIADDLTSYYLMGYYSTNTKLDGGFRTIKVRSKRPGIEIRSRHGYRAATEAEVAAAKAAADTQIPEAKLALGRALGYLESDARAQGRRMVRGAGEPLLFHRGLTTGNQLQPAQGRVFPRSDRIRLEMEATAGDPVWTGALLDRNGGKTVVPVATADRIDPASGQRWLTADVTLAPLGPGDYVVELTSTAGSQQKKTLMAIRVTP